MENSPAYDEQIRPLMAKIIDICEANKIPFIANFSISAEEVVTTALSGHSKYLSRRHGIALGILNEQLRPQILTNIVRKALGEEDEPEREPLDTVAIYEEQIQPISDQIFDICEANHIPMLMDFEVFDSLGVPCTFNTHFYPEGTSAYDKALEVLEQPKGETKELQTLH